MKIIKPAEISSKIMTLIDESDKELIIVSPYNNLSKWDKMQKHLQDARNRNIMINYYVRENEYPRGLDELGIVPIPIPNLHAKFYMNEKTAIVTSMNLIFYSDTHSLEIGYALDENGELAELREFYDRYLLKHKSETAGKVISATSLKGRTLTKNTKQEIVFPKHLRNANWIDNSQKVYSKTYHPKSTFIKEYGYSLNGHRIASWVSFRENGFVSHQQDYDNGILVKTISPVYDYNVSRYYIVMSLANIIGGLYKVPIADLYFDSFIADYVENAPALLYHHLEEHLQIKFSDFANRTFSELIEEILWRLKGNNGKFPYRIKNGS